jgi:hypothetical protein
MAPAGLREPTSKKEKGPSLIFFYCFIFFTCMSVRGRIYYYGRGVEQYFEFYQPFRKGCSMRVRFVSGVVALLVSVSVAMAQDASSVGAGSKALLFSFSGLNNLAANTYNGGIGGKYFLTAPLAVRAALQFANSATVTKATAPMTLDATTSSTTYGISAGAEYHFAVSRVSPYGGAEVLFSSTSSESKSSAVSSTTQTTLKNALGSAGTTIKVSAILGAEFFMTKELSLGGEYQLGFSSTSRPNEESTTGSTTTTRNGGSATQIGIGTTLLTLSLYF